MKIKVYNDGKLTFAGKAKDFLIINQFQGETKQLLKDCFMFGESRQLLFSGLWEAYRIGRK